MKTTGTTHQGLAPLYKQSALKQYKEEYKLATQPEEEAPPPPLDEAPTETEEGQLIDQTHERSSPTTATVSTRLNVDQVLGEMKDLDQNDDDDGDWDEEAFEAMLENEEEVLEQLGRKATEMDMSTKTTEDCRKYSVAVPVLEEEEQDIPDDLNEEDWMDEEAEAAMRELEG